MSQIGHADIDENKIGRNMFHMELIVPTSSQLGLALKNVLTKANITQDTLATKAGIPRNTLNRKINGGVFRFDELTRISKVCKMPLSKILEQAEKQAALASKEKSQPCLPG